MRVPWGAPRADSDGRIYTGRGYSAKQGGKAQFKIDKYEEILMAPLTPEGRRLFYSGIAWAAAWPFIGIGGVFVGLVLMPQPRGYGGFADWLFSALGLVGLMVGVAAWVLPIVRASKAWALATETVRDAREDAFETLQ